MDSQVVNTGIEGVPEGITGTTGTMGMISQKTARWASPGDWDEQKQRIVYLYMSLDHPLWKVIQEMREEHGFMAT